MSVPGRSGRCRVATSARGIRRGSATMIGSPRWRAAARRRMPNTGCCSVVFEPITKTARASATMSSMELVIAPEPRASVSATTVGAWHSRAQ
jgi:hypothetical protein